MTEWVGRAEELKRIISDSSFGSNSGPKSGATKDSLITKKSKDSSEEERSQLRSSLACSILGESPNVPWEAIAGLENAKNALKEAVIMPIRFPNLFTGKRTPWRGILLYGPPGTGKTQLAKATATEAKATFFSVSSSDLVSKYQGESERLIRELFEMARERKPSIIFIDEVDSLCGTRGEGETESSRRIKTEILVQMSGVGHDQAGVLVLGATNTPWTLDSAIRRRFEKRIYIPLPDLSARNQLVRICIDTTPHSLTTAQMGEIAKQTDRFSGADISTLVREALYEPVRRLQSATHFRAVSKKDAAGALRKFWVPCSPGSAGAIEKTWTEINGDELGEMDLAFPDFVRALQNIRRTVSDVDLIKQEQFTAEFGVEG